MSVSDADIELLEAHLDGELPSQEDAALRARLTSNSELSTELARLRAHREIRIEVFESFEPDDLTVKQLILGVRKQITRDAVRGVLTGSLAVRVMAAGPAAPAATPAR